MIEISNEPLTNSSSGKSEQEPSETINLKAQNIQDPFKQKQNPQAPPLFIPPKAAAHTETAKHSETAVYAEAAVHTEAASIAYHAAMPYPPVNAGEKNPRYAAVMLDNLGGTVSEISAVSSYFYNQLITSEYKEISETFHHISIVEMHHMEIFGNLAMQLGENPRLWSHRGRRGQYMYWSPGCITYPPYPVNRQMKKTANTGCGGPTPVSSLKTLLSLSIEGEEKALKKYMQQTTWIQNTNICDNLRRISADEQMHIDILTRLYHKY